jgi:hypothetical protein
MMDAVILGLAIWVAFAAEALAAWFVVTKGDGP